MGSSNRKKKEKKKDFQKTKLKVGNAKAKAANYTDTSFKSKSIVVNQQNLSTSELEPIEQFKHHLSLASSAKSDNQKKDALSHLISQLSAKPPNNPVGTAGLLAKLLPSLSDGSAAVRSQLIKLFRLLPPSEVGPHADRILLYVRGGMTHLSAEIRADTLNVLEWLLEVAGDEAVSCPGGWLKTLSSFSSMLGWNANMGAASANKGWTSASKSDLLVKKGPLVQARQILVLAQFIKAGFRPATPVAYDSRAYWDNLYRPPRTPNSFAYLNLFGSPRDEDSEMYLDRESRQIIFDKKWRVTIAKGMDTAKKEGGAVGRSAAALDQALKAGLDGDRPVVQP
ncbi:hypothetical protein GQ53DRAFT_446706 [Thozetella sp. PMI_491]|nr:hypothetical protein GQ53DRAFT_446706 [Thozetella sp. PMI_491]